MKKHMKHLRFVSVFLIILLIISGNMVFANQFVENANAESNPEDQVDVVEGLSYPLIVQEEPTSGISETGEESQGDIVTPLEPDVDSSVTVILDSNSGDLPEPISFEAGSSLDELPVPSKNVEENTALNANEEDQSQDSETVVGELTIINVDIVEFFNSGNKIENIKIGDPYVLSTKVISGEVGQSWFSETKEDIAEMEYFSHSYGDSDIDYSNYGYFAEGERTLIQFYQPIGYDWGVNEPGKGYVGVAHRGDFDGSDWDIKLDTEIISGNLGESWTTSPKDFDYWIYATVYTDNMIDPIDGGKGLISGIFRETEPVNRHQWLTYVYVYAGHLVVEYKDIDTGEKIAVDSPQIKGMVTSKRELYPKDIEGYELVTELNENGGKVFRFPYVKEGDHVFAFEYKKKTSVEVTKAWADGDNQDGVRPESVIIKLLADGVETDKTLTLTASNNWTGTFSALYEYANGEPINYTLEEVAIENGYEASVTGTAADGYTVINSRMPETIAVEGSKGWDDYDDQDGKRPESITIRLLKNGEEIDSKIVTEEDDWVWSFADLAKYEDGELITYTVVEDPVDDYITIYTSDYNVINSRMPETIAVEGSKGWDDYDDQDGKRPESITIRLLKNGEEIDSKIVTEEDDWVWSFADLAKYEDGELITYSVMEDPVDDYITIYTSDYNVINSRMPSKTSVEVTKVWSDGDNQDGMRPESVTIKLLADGVETDKTLRLTASNNWTGSFSDLDEYAKGELITYTVEEVALGKGYTAVVSGDQETGYKVTNTRTPSQPTKPSESKPASPVASTGESLTMYGWIGALFLGLGLFLMVLKREYRLRRKHE